MAKETPIITHLLQEVVVHIENLYSDYKVTKPECTIISRLKDYLNGMEAGAISAGTHFAEKLHQAQQEYGKVSTMLLDLDAKHEQARALLQKFISRHEAGLLPDRFIYDEIKTFLDGK